MASGVLKFFISFCVPFFRETRKKVGLFATSPSTHNGLPASGFSLLSLAVGILQSFSLIVLISINTFAQAQEIKVNGYFSADSVKLGQPISFYLSARYPQSQTVLFPDSSYSFAPFEFQKKKITTTKTTNGISYDSVAYTLATFEIDRIQTLRLPVFIVHPKDCTVVYTNKDTVFFQALVKSLPDSVQLEKLPLKTNTAYNPVSWLLNYPLLSIIIGILIALLAVGWIIFGKRIRKHFKLKRLNKEHQAFLQQFNSAIEKNLSGTNTTAEAALVVWKKYLESLLSKPYTKLTSKEIIKAEKDVELAKALSRIDRTIYGNVPADDEPFSNLKSFSEQKFQTIIEELKNG